jgi:hypothetical protein
VFSGMKTPTSSQIMLGFSPLFIDQLNTKHPLFRLANQIDWNLFERYFFQALFFQNGEAIKTYQINGFIIDFKIVTESQ